jgi:hypothetical protein
VCKPLLSIPLPKVREGGLNVITESEREEYLAEIRRQVCSRCKERPAGGPPCAPLGKPCGVELYLPELIEAIHDVQGELIEPYWQRKQQLVCSRCAYLHSDACPCPMDYWFVPILHSVELVDRHRQLRARSHQLVAGLPGQNRPDLGEVARAYEEAAGTWTGCDWTTRFGNNDLDLNGWTAAEAESMAVESTDPEEVEDWRAAAEWLAQVEKNAGQAEAQAALAVAAANAEEWGEALEHARRALLLEFASGRPLWNRAPLTWQGLWNAIRDAATASVAPSAPAAGNEPEKRFGDDRTS